MLSLGVTDLERVQRRKDRALQGQTDDVLRLPMSPISITEQGSQTMYTPSSPLQSKQPFVWGSSMLALS